MEKHESKTLGDHLCKLQVNDGNVSFFTVSVCSTEHVTTTNHGAFCFMADIMPEGCCVSM